jgi:hypothetical protein
VTALFFSLKRKEKPHRKTQGVFLFASENQMVFFGLAEKKREEGLPLATLRFSFLVPRAFFLFLRERRDWL